MGKIAFLFSGQGHQSPGLLSLFDGMEKAQELRRDAIQSQALSPELVKYLEDPDADSRRICHNLFAQQWICLFHQMAWASIGKNIDSPILLAGYSIGQLGASAASGAISPLDALLMSRLRAEFMDEVKPEGRMAAVLGLDFETLSGLCMRHGASIAICVDKTHFTIGAPEHNMESFISACRPLAREIVPLNISVASHIPMMKTAMGKFSASIENLGIKNPEIPVLSGINGKKMWRGSEVRNDLLSQISNTVRWDFCMRALIEEDCSVFFEIGPGSDLSRMIHRQFPAMPARSLCEFSNAESALNWIRQVNIH